MVDFSKLSRPKTAAERVRDDQDRIAREIEQDLARRSQWTRKTVALTLIRETEFRHSLSGDRALHLHGAQADGKTVSVTWYAPDHFTHEQTDAVFNQLVEDVSVTLDGYWTTSTFNGKKRFTFVAQFIRVGDGPRIP